MHEQNKNNTQLFLRIIKRYKMYDVLIKLIREMTMWEARIKILNREERYKKKYIMRAKKWSQIKHLQTKYNNTKHK